MCNILLATPEAEDREFLKDIFTTYFFNVTFLPDVIYSDEAYRIAKQEKIDILILDLSQSPELAFKYKTKIVKEQPNVKVILLDDEQNTDHLQVALRCGAIDYLVKPLILEECQTAIHRAITSLNEVSLFHADQSSTETKQDENIHNMIQYIHEHYNEELTLERLANLMHLDQSYVSRSFKEVVGMTFIEYLQYYRIEQAKKKLQSTSLSITEIAENVGYSNLTYFSRVFKKTTGYIPSQYKKTFKGKHILPDYYYVHQYLEEKLTGV
ncbi:helix-turn-helix domain-containing protein [Virgibacillus kimchii]